MYGMPVGEKGAEWACHWAGKVSESPWRSVSLMGPWWVLPPSTPAEGEVGARSETQGRLGGVRAHPNHAPHPTTFPVTAYLLPNLLSDVIQLSRQCVCLQGPFQLLLVLEQVTMEIAPPGREGEGLSEEACSPLLAPLPPAQGLACG